MSRTVVFSDLKGSTALGERLDPETLRSVLSRYFDEMTLVFEGHGGTVEKIIGDAIVTVFDAPDHAVRAVRAVAEAAATLDLLDDVLERSHDIRLVNRTGIATGELTIAGSTATGRVLTGPAIDTAMTLEAAAPPLGALLSTPTIEAVGDLVVTEPSPDHDAGLLISVSEPVATRRRCDRCGADHPNDRPCSITNDGGDTRRTVSVVFADPRPEWVTDPSSDEVAATMSRYFAAVRAVLESHGATVERFIGDAVMAVFGLPVRHEDDAARALRSAVAIRNAVDDLNRELAADGVVFDTRIGVNTGAVVAGEAEPGQRLVTGDAVNVAARLEQAAGHGEILIGDSTARLVTGVAETEPVAPLSLKGKTDPVPAHRLVEIAAGRGSAAADTPMIGRGDELTRLLTITDPATPESRAIVTGEAGVGKTRLVADLTAGAEGRMTVLRGHCLEYGEGITLWPIAEIVRAAAGVHTEDSPATALERIARLTDDPAVADRLSSIAGLVATQYPMGELAWSVRRLLESLASEQPVLVILEDAQWAEDALFDLVDDVGSATASAEVSLVIVARPELEATRPAWFGGWGEVVALHPLTPSQVGRIAESVLQGTITDALRDHVATAADGNPLFAEHVVRMLHESGAIEERGGAWGLLAGSEDTAVPATIDALLGARLDALDPERRGVLGTASVVGRRFPIPAVGEMLADDPADLPSHLSALVAAALTEVVSPATTDEDEIHGFRHLLLRDVAYGGLLKAHRADLHERFVAWADVVNARRGRELEFEEILGYHLEQAHRYLSEVSRLDDHGVAIGIEGSRRLAAAANRALLRGDVSAAAGLTARARALLPPGHERIPSLMLRLGECRFEGGAFDEGKSTVRAAIDAARTTGDRSTELAAELELLRMDADTGADVTEVTAALDRLRPEAESDGSPAALTRMWRLLATSALVAMRWTEAEHAARRMVENARASGELATELRVLPALAGIARYGPLPVDDAIALCDDLLTRTVSNRRAEVFTLLPRARLLAMRGEFDAARTDYRSARSTLTDMGWSLDAALVSLDSGPIELLAGDPAAAAAELSLDRAALLDMGDDYYVATTTALLAEATYRLGALEEAGALAAEVEAIAEPDDIAPQYMWRIVAARIAARDGSTAKAVALLEEAEGLIDPEQDPNALGWVLAAQAEALDTLGERAASSAAVERARDAFGRKGNVAAIRRLTELLDDRRVTT